MPMPFYMKVTGATQGEIKGSCTQAPFEDQILCQALTHMIEQPRDEASGLPTGKRVHGPITITMVMDESTPLLAQALSTNESLQVELTFVKVNPAGLTEIYFMIELADASIVNLDFWIPNCLDTAKASYQHMVDVAFAYARIVWTQSLKGVQGEDEWESEGA